MQLLNLLSGSGIQVARILAFCLIGVLASTDTLGQSLSDGSIYSRFGIGERKLFHSSMSQAMGGGGIALGSGRYINYGNPASWSSQTLTRLSGGFTHETIHSEATGVDRGTLSSGALTALGIGFPLYVNKTGFALSFNPYTRVSYRVDVPRSLPSDPDSGDEELFTTSYKGNGGLQVLGGGLGHQFTENLSVGASLEYVFGILEQTQRTSFGSDDYVDLDVVESTRLNGVTGTLGVRYSRDEVFNETDGLRIGASVTLPASLSGRRVFTLDSALESDTLSNGGTGDVTLPLSVRVGFAYVPNPRWTLIADFQLEQWSGFESTFDFPGYDASSDDGLSNQIRVSGGFEYWPAGGRPFGNYIQRTAYRFGLYRDESYVSPVDGQTINVIGVTGGLSLPTLSSGTTIDLNLDVGRRGNLDNGLIRDTFIRFGLNVNFGERWFNRLPLL